MDAGKKILLDLLTGSLRFVVPVYQRRYSWGETQCRQLWADIVTAGRNPDRTHFTGSIVWMQDGGIGPDGVSRCQLIDGQQRLTSVTLLLIALAEYAREHPENLRFSADMLIDRGYLVDKYATGEGRYKLTLSGDDSEYLQLSRPLIIPFQGHRYCQRRPVADRFKATDPLWSGFEHGLSVPLPHVELAGVDPYRVVHDAVEDGVGDGVAAETAVPFLGGQLGRERGAGVVVAQFHELKQEAPELLVGLVHEPFVDREQRVRGVFAHELGRTSRFEGRGRDLFREVGHPYVAGPVASPARGFHQRA